jgi:CheY-like chemotaxis protein
MGKGMANQTMRLEKNGAQRPVVLQAQSMPSGGQGSRRSPHRRILIIEDNKDSADSLQLLLELLGHEARVAYSGLEGVKAAVDWVPEAVISDIGLPGLDGYGVAAELRKTPATSRILLIGVSGYGQDEDRYRARAAGFDYYLVKPASPDELQRLLTAGK